jgi:hypothetical protein
MPLPLGKPGVIIQSLAGDPFGLNLDLMAPADKQRREHQQDGKPSRPQQAAVAEKFAQILAGDDREHVSPSYA